MILSRVFCFALALGLTLFCHSPSHFASDDPTTSIKNEFIKIIVNHGPEDLGRFAIETTQGRPNTDADDHQSLIFGRPIPWTSYTTVLIDDVPYVFGGPNTKIQKRSGITMNYGVVLSQEITANAILTVCRFGEIDVQQTLTFFRNPTTRVNDSALIRYDIHNNGPVAHRVGIRIMVDTKLGSNDGAPFRIGDQAIESEQLFSGSDLLEYWQTFDNLTSPNVIAQGIIQYRGNKVLPPNRLYLANWGTLVDHPWTYPYQKGRSFIREGEFDKDTALAMYWDPKDIAPSGRATVQTVYGLGGLSLQSGELSLGLTAPAEVYHNRPDSFLMVAYVLNSGSFDSENTRVIFDLPKGFELVKGHRTVSLGKLKRGHTKQVPIRVKLRNAITGPQRLSITVESSTLESNTLSRKIDVLGPIQIQSFLTAPTQLIVTSNPFFDVSLSLSNPSFTDLDNVAVSLKLPDSVDLPLFDRHSTKTVPSLAARSSHTLHWKLKLIPPYPRSFLINTTIKSPVIKPKQLKRRISVFEPDETIELSLSKIPNAVPDYFFVTVALRYAEGFVPPPLSLSFDPTILKLSRVSIPPWVRKTGQRSAYDYSEQHLDISTLSSIPKKSYYEIGKFHFKRLSPSANRIVLKSNGNVISEMPIPVVETHETNP